MSWNYYPPYVSAAERRAKALKKIASLEKKGMKIEPVGTLAHRIKIATSFWGRGWCRHLESFSDYENRLPRGRTYVRGGAVLHLQVEAGNIHALVQGSELYEIKIRIDPLTPKKWAAIKKRCHGGIGSLIELLQGRISDEIMSVVTDPSDGLFPLPKEIHLDCNCPDYAGLCKHLAAVLYGVGARLDSAPSLLFTLRGVDQGELIAAAGAAESLGGGKPSRRRTLQPDALSDVFGVDLEDAEPAEIAKPSPKPKPSKKVKLTKPPKTKKKPKKPVAKGKRGKSRPV